MSHAPGRLNRKPGLAQLPAVELSQHDSRCNHVKLDVGLPSTIESRPRDSNSEEDTSAQWKLAI